MGGMAMRTSDRCASGRLGRAVLVEFGLSLFLMTAGMTVWCLCGDFLPGILLLAICAGARFQQALLITERHAGMQIYNVYVLFGRQKRAVLFVLCWPSMACQAWFAD